MQEEQEKENLVLLEQYMLELLLMWYKCMIKFYLTCLVTTDLQLLVFCLSVLAVFTEEG